MIQNDDIALVIRPNIGTNKQWLGTVDLKAVIMPRDNVSDDTAQELVHLLNGLVACFHLLNEDEGFANKVNETLARLQEEGAFEFSVEEPTYANVIQMSDWTPTKGNA